MHMCGIAGIVKFDQGTTKSGLTDLIQRMGQQLKHRGPDDQGVWCDDRGFVGFAHRRLSIIDLSESGHQPMVSHSERHVIVFNGEIYNSEDLRREVDQSAHSIPWRGHSDTEILLEAIDLWGVRKTLAKVNGMFAFGIWDCIKRTLVIARDRLGEKPLYYGHINGDFVFVSELKALRAHPGWDPVINREALAAYVGTHYIRSPDTIYRNISQLRPGHYIKLGVSQSSKIVTNSYWELADIIRSNAFDESLRVSDPEAAVEQLDDLLSDSVRMRMISDAPIGAFLSGGYDSSTIVSLMQEKARRPVKTYSIGFEDQKFNEATHAKKVSKALGTDHTELYISSKEVQDIIPDLSDISDGPFGDSSQIPTYLVAKLAASDVKVCLSGDGGDELFGGYTHYSRGEKIWRILQRCPRQVRLIASRIIRMIGVRSWENILAPFTSLNSEFFKSGKNGDRIHKLTKLLESKTDRDVYTYLTAFSDHPSNTVLRAGQNSSYSCMFDEFRGSLTFPEVMMAQDTVSYLVDDILTKVDRTTMSVGLEARVPLLDHRIVEFAWKLPVSLKVRKNYSKIILKKLNGKHLPPEMMRRPKTGFSVPLEDWLRGCMKDWVEDLLSDSRLKQQGIFDPRVVGQRWREHKSGLRNWQGFIFDIAMFQSWYDKQSSRL